MDDGEAPDPAEVRTRGDFARQLTHLRVRADLTVRQVAAKAEAFGAHSTVGDWFAGRGLPSSSSQDLLVRVLSACGVDGEPAISAWLEAWRRVRRLPGRRERGPAPYRGLASFQPEDAGWFFGRRALLGQLTDRIAGLRRAGGGVLVVVGASGSGKSSLLRAGVVPAGGKSPLDGCEVRLMTPGSHPLAELENTAGRPGGVLIVDQFEETFTACADPGERRAFVARLAGLAAGPAGAVVVLGLRADFYGQALSQPGLYEVIADRAFTVGPMSESELREVIAEPAVAARVDLEDGLVELLLRDAVSRATGSAGVLPLLSHALFATWSHGDGRRMTIADYREIGGIDKAVSATADAVLAGLTEAQRDDARRLFLSLVRVSPDTADTRRRVPLAHGAEVGDVLDRFVADRLITVDAECVEISHEALLAAWPTLRGWLAADRAGLLLEQQLREAAAEWRHAGRDRSLLYRGPRLATAQQWAAGRELPAAVREFLDTGTRQARRRTRQLYQVFAALVALAVTAALLAGYAFRQRAVLAGERREAVGQRNEAVSRLVATRADRLRASDPSLAYQLGLAAYRISPTVEARSSLLSSSAGPQVARLIGAAGAVQAVAYRPDHRVLAAASVDHTVRLWDTSRPDRTPTPLAAPLTGPAGDLFGLAFSPDGGLLAAAGADRAVHLWHTADPRHPVALPAPLAGPGSTVYALAFSPDGRTLVAGSADRKVWRWDLSDPGRPRPLPALTGSAGAVQAVRFDPAGGLLAAGGADGTVRLWRITAPAGARPLATLRTGGQYKVLAVAFSPDGTTLAAGGGDKVVRFWQVTGPGAPRPRPERLTGPTSWINGIQFSPDGGALAAGSSDKSVTVWDLASRRVTATLLVPSPVTAVGYGPGAGTIAAAGTDGAVRVWTVPGPVLAGHSDAVFNAVFGPGILATASRDETVRLWDVTDRRRPVPAGGPFRSPVAGEGFSASIAVSPDGRTLAAGTRTGPVQLWDIADPRRPTARPGPLTGPTALVEAVAFSPDGRLLAAGSDDGDVRLWNLPTRTPAATIPGSGAALILSVTFSPDGRTVAVTSTAGTTSLWDVTDPAGPRAIGPPLGGFTGYAYSAAFSPDGRLLAASSADRTTRLWDVTDRLHPRPLGAALTGPASYAYWTAFAPDGRSLAVASTDDAVWIWDLTDPRRPAPWATLTGATDALYTVQYSPDGHTLAAAGADTTTRLWDTSTDRVRAWICATSGDGITAAEWAQYVPGVPYSPPCAG